jgi:hypothetical protein
MTAITFNAVPRAAIKSKLRGFFAALSGAIDAFAMYRMQRAVPEYEMRRCDREIKRLRRPACKPAARQQGAKQQAPSSPHTAQPVSMR